MRRPGLIPALGLLTALSAAVLRGQMAGGDELESPGTSAIPISWGNTTLENGFLPGTAETLRENIEIDIIVAAIFVGLVMLLMAVAIYITWKRRGQERCSWEEQATKESLAQATGKHPR